MRTYTPRVLILAVLILLLSAGTALAATGTDQNLPTDIKGHWAEETIRTMLDSGVIAGYTDGTFKPSRSITRAEFTTIVNKAFGTFDENAEASFVDVNKSHWYYRQAASGKAAGFISGYPDGTFKPNTAITREQAAVILANLLQLKGEKGTVQFTDAVQVSAWAKPSVKAVSDAKIVGGYPDGTFKPLQSLTRAETVVIVERALTLGPDRSKPVEPEKPEPNVPNQGQVKQIEVTGNVVNLRQGPGTNHPIVGQVNQGTRLPVLGSSEGWYQVTAPNGVSAYIASDYTRVLESTPQPSEPSPQPTPPVQEPSSGEQTAVVTGKVVNLRSGAGTIYPQIGQVKQGEKLQVFNRSGDWYLVKSNNGQQGWIAGWLIELEEIEPPSRGESPRPDPEPGPPVVVLDPGHGGRDPGAIGPQGTYEKNIALPIALKVGQILEQDRIIVVYTRSSDTYVNLMERSNIANRADADVFVSIHCNGHPDPVKQGISTYYYAPASNPMLAVQANERRALATCLQKSLLDHLGRDDMGVRQDNFSVLRETMIPAALVEFMFITNPQEEALLKLESIQEAAATAIACGIKDYLQQTGSL